MNPKDMGEKEGREASRGEEENGSMSREKSVKGKNNKGEK